MANPYHELAGDAFFVSCKPNIDSTNTEDIWREKAGTGRFIKTDITQTGSRGHGLLPIELLADNDGEAYGRLDSVQGEGDRFTATVCVLGADMHALGNIVGNTALTDADIGKTLRGAGDGKLKIVSDGAASITYAAFAVTSPYTFRGVTAPGSPAANDVYFNTTTNYFQLYSSGSWANTTLATITGNANAIGIGIGTGIPSTPAIDTEAEVIAYFVANGFDSSNYYVYYDASASAIRQATVYTAAGFGRVVGGNQTDLRIAFNGIENVR